jgi:molecular chaperone GrpE (heat shock protein)
MVKRAQFDYINLKMDFDRYKNNTETNAQEHKKDLQIAAVKKFLPFVENMRKSLESLDDTQSKTALAE